MNWNGRSICCHMVQTNQLNDQKVCMNWNGRSFCCHIVQTNQLNDQKVCMNWNGRSILLSHGTNQPIK